MDYTVKIDQFEGPLDLLLHLLKESNLDIYEIRIEEITRQYMNYIHAMQQMNLNVASEYLTMAAELMEMKSAMLLPRRKEEALEEESDPRGQLIERLLLYKQYKEVTHSFRQLEEERKEIFTKEASDLSCYQVEEKKEMEPFDVQLLLEAISRFLSRKELEKPLHTKITRKEYSVQERSLQIRSLLHRKKKVEFSELFDILTKEYVVVTFLAILNMAKKQELKIEQEDNFAKIYLHEQGSEQDE